MNKEKQVNTWRVDSQMLKKVPVITKISCFMSYFGLQLYSESLSLDCIKIRNHFF